MLAAPLAVVGLGHEQPVPYFNSSPEVIRLVVMMYVRYPLSLRNVEDLLAERGIDVSHETVRFWWNRFGPMFAAEIRKKRVAHMRGYPPRDAADILVARLVSRGVRAKLFRAAETQRRAA